MSREEWLKRAVRVLRPLLERKAKVTMRKRWQVSMSLTSKKTAIGQCWYDQASASGKTCNLFVSPVHADPVEILDTLLHEMVHAALPVGVHHGKKFKDACQAIGLTKGKPTEAAAGPELRAILVRVASFLGPLRHDALTPSYGGRSGSKGGYWPVFVSPADERYRIQISARALEELGPPICPITRELMVEAGPGKGKRYPAR